mmetsp:Transcript_1806/g.4608  ORF Transcript_1806/g.4608 Transcript_1806/m.4608 type:complete len:203 (-) Transcript_1806:352-960(-)
MKTCCLRSGRLANSFPSTVSVPPCWYMRAVSSSTRPAVRLLLTHGAFTKLSSMSSLACGSVCPPMVMVPSTTRGSGPVGAARRAAGCSALLAAAAACAAWGCWDAAEDDEEDGAGGLPASWSCATAGSSLGYMSSSASLRGSANTALSSMGSSRELVAGGLLPLLLGCSGEPASNPGTGTAAEGGRSSISTMKMSSLLVIHE